MTTIALVDDHKIVRQGIKGLLEDSTATVKKHTGAARTDDLVVGYLNFSKLADT